MERFIITTDSPLFTPSVPDKSFKSFIRAACAMEYAIERRARDYGYTIEKTIYYEVDEDTFIIEYKDIFDLKHAFCVKRIWD